MFVAANICLDKGFVATNIMFSQQNFCHDKHAFVATKMIFMEAPANDSSELCIYVVMYQRYREIEKYKERER